MVVRKVDNVHGVPPILIAKSSPSTKSVPVIVNVFPPAIGPTGES